jgi:hypothetical protein
MSQNLGKNLEMNFYGKLRLTKFSRRTMMPSKKFMQKYFHSLMMEKVTKNVLI